MNEAREISNIFIEAQECVKIMEYLLLPDPQNDVYNKRSNGFWVYAASEELSFEKLHELLFTTIGKLEFTSTQIEKVVANT